MPASLEQHLWRGRVRLARCLIRPLIAAAGLMLLSLPPRGAALAQPVEEADQATTLPVNAMAATIMRPVSGKEPGLELDVPPSPDAIPMLPPLSIEECLANLKKIESRLANPEIGMNRWEPNETSRVFGYLLDYIQLTDRKHSSLGNYAWKYLGANKVAEGVTDRDSFHVTPALPNVTAISYTATGGNVRLERIEVVDVADNRYEMTVNRDIISDLPRREVTFLHPPVTVKEVVAFYAALDGKPRVAVYGGISRRPEHLKAARYYLQTSQKAIAAGEREPAHKAIQEAGRQLALFLRR